MASLFLSLGCRWHFDLRHLFVSWKLVHDLRLCTNINGLEENLEAISRNQIYAVPVLQGLLAQRVGAEIERVADLGPQYRRAESCFQNNESSQVRDD